MVDDLYVVGLDFRQLGTPSILRPQAEVQLRRMESRMDRFRSGWSDFSRGGSGFVGMLDGVAGALGRIALIGGGLVAATGIVGLTHATVGLNSELEKATIAIGTILNVQGMSSSLNQGLAVAAGTIQDMRKDAAALPGEFGDLLQIFKLGATSAFQSGLGVDEWRKLASKTMAAGVVADLGGGLPQVAREMTALLQGRAGAHNVFGMTLGLSGAKAEEFNQMTGPERVKALDAVLNKYGQSIETFSTTWDAVSSTFVDNVKLFATTATSPLFDKVKDQIREANDWYEQNQETVQRYAEIIGMRLSEAWEVGKAKVLEWGPILMEFVDNASTRLGQIWTDIEPGVTRIGELLQDALKDPGTIDRMITLAKLWLAIKGGQAAFGVASGAFGMGKGAFKMGREAMGFLGAGGLIGASGAAAGTAGAGAAAGGAATGGLIAAGGLLPALGAASLALGTWTAAIVQGTKLYNEHLKDGMSDEDKSRAAILEAIERDKQSMLMRGMSEQQIADELDKTSWQAQDLAARMRDLSKEGEAARAGFGDVNLAAMDLKANLYAAAAAAQHFRAMADVRVDQVHKEIIGPAEANTQLKQLQMIRDAMGPGFLKPPRGAEQAAGHKGGGGGTRIQKVEIVVTGNDNPSRVAREVMGHLNHLARTPTQSKYAPRI